ncbi:nuclear transport factor 2 family protein [Polyangium jinanense]|uniref:Nuclear transport factor 2 family protein n=1 Tax=Polyangium jinanense TaxID=2829994 RepID=A0A9X4B0R2_9BACT|nr:nuclear transport factor 2 family protein [Polyangium jinanense]MDC3962564.1 nuclear transport factor 2 family protein [Polyangium jinanense]MDC3962681.1 nuclear transport factor 2 family protein [Polyangium jinanense]MDC3989422.1 nuclear transport factor 2 family protein [Polyangium jinanense]
MKEAEARQIIEAYFHAAMKEPDIRVFTAFFAPDGVLEDPVGTPPLRGREAIASFLEAGKSKLGPSEIVVREIITCGSESAVRWSGDLLTKRGERLNIEGIGVFTFDEQNKLRHVREFYDVAKLLAIFS